MGTRKSPFQWVMGGEDVYKRHHKLNEGSVSDPCVPSSVHQPCRLLITWPILSDIKSKEGRVIDFRAGLKIPAANKFKI